MDVSIIIINYNTISYLCTAIDSVLKKTLDIKYEIIVVDNNSSDNSEAIISQKYGNKIAFIKLPKNIGFGCANNVGAKYAKGDYLFLLNPDTILLNNAVKVLLDFIKTNKQTGICGGNLYDSANNPTHSYGCLPSISVEFKELFAIYDEYFNHTKNPKKVGYITGADLMISTELYNQLNGFDNSFFMYYEDTELNYRVKKNGYSIYNIPKSKIIHLEGKSFNSNLDQQQKRLDSRNLFYRKTHSSFYHCICNIIFYLTAISRIVVFSLIRNKYKKEFWQFIIKNY